MNGRVCATTIGLCLFLSGCGNGVASNGQAATPAASASPCVRDGQASDRQRYLSVGALADASTSVVRGTVTAKDPGATSGEDTFMEYSVRTDEVLAGDDLPPSWRLRTGYLTPDGCEVAFNGAGVLNVGDAAVIFVTPAGTGSPGVYSALGTQGRFQTFDDDTLARTARVDALSRRVEAGKASDLRQAVRASRRGRPGQ